VTESIDVMPTVLDLAGLAIPEKVQGRSLRRLWEDREGWTPRAAFSESLSEKEEQKGLRDERYKYVVTVDAATVEARGRSFVPPGPPAALYDLLRDPGERHDLLAGETDEATRRRALAMEAELRQRLAVVGRPETGMLSDDALEGLKALGYVE
jgi:arylsulfatase A-like enzyme